MFDDILVVDDGGAKEEEKNSATKGISAPITNAIFNQLLDKIADNTTFRSFMDKEEITENNPYSAVAAEIGDLVFEKNKAYGDSFKRSCLCVDQMYPYGIPPSQYPHALYIIRVLDKLFRIATDKDAFGENPKRDIAGYSILGVVNDQIKEEEKDV
jgi:hypothetical protein